MRYMSSTSLFVATAADHRSQHSIIAHPDGTLGDEFLCLWSGKLFKGRQPRGLADHRRRGAPRKRRARRLLPPRRLFASLAGGLLVGQADGVVKERPGQWRWVTVGKGHHAVLEGRPRLHRGKLAAQREVIDQAGPVGKRLMNRVALW